MKQLILGILVTALSFLTSCNIQERIVFNEDMGGTYENNMDLSTLMSLAGQNEFSDPEKKKVKLDTTIVFSELVEVYKDSISQLSVEQYV